MPRHKDEIGNRYGYLAVTELQRPVKVNGSSRKNRATNGARWICLCDCGKETVAYGWMLRAGRHHSCGCNQYEALHKRNAEAKKVVEARKTLVQFIGHVGNTVYA